MSYFSAALERALEESSWSQQDLIAATKIHRTSMSGYVRGSAPVGARTLRRICEAVPESQRPFLARAWLLDQLPRELQALIEIVPQSGIVREDAPAIAPDCPEEIRRGLDLLARKSVHAPVRELILDLARLLSSPPPA